MCAEKRQSRPTLQRVAKHLYRRGNSYEFFRRIPPDAQHLTGVATKSVSFGDVSRREAEHMAADLRKETDRLIAKARRQPDPTGRAEFRRSKITPTFDEIDATVRQWVLEHEARVLSATGPEDAKRVIGDMRQISEITPVHLREGRSKALVSTSWIADSLARQNGWSLSADGRESRYLFDRVGRAQRELAVRVRAELNYEDSPAATHATFDRSAFEKDRQAATLARRGPAPIMDIFERYAVEQEPASKTRKKWKVALNSLIEHLGHDDATRITPEDIIGWKDSLLAPRSDGGKPRGQGTVRNGYLGAVKPVFQWAVTNRLIESNPAAGITVSVPRRRVTRIEKGYSKAEAEIVLAAASAVDWESDGTFVAFARRWLPWLCAYTGARVGEIAQLRRGDIFKAPEGIWAIKITPEAGSQKSNRARLVAMHPHLIEQGFLEAIEGREGSLFYDPTLRRKGSDGNTQYQKVGERIAKWVRSLGLTDKELQPNHGWRHRFITVARSIGMNDNVCIAFVGHSPKTEHDGYGDATIETSYEWIKRVPRYEIGSTVT